MKYDKRVASSNCDNWLWRVHDYVISSSLGNPSWLWPDLRALKTIWTAGKNNQDDVSIPLLPTLPRVFSSSCLKTKGCSKKTWVLIPTWPPVTTWSLGNLFHRHHWSILRIQVFEKLGAILSLQWCLILCVNLTGFLGAQMKHHFLVCLWGCFQMRLELESVHLVITDHPYRL